MKLRDAKPGVVVTCIGSFTAKKHDPFQDISEIKVPQKGQNYTIREVIQTADGDYGLRFEEIRNRKFWHQKGGNQEPCFSLKRFRCV